MSAVETARTGTDRQQGWARRGGLAAAVRFETRKLTHQLRSRALLIGAVLAPIAVVVVVHGQARPPKDTLFGRYATTDGFSLALLILGVASQWVLPLLTAVVAGDIAASEDQHGTWKTVLTRSTGRMSLFWAKVLVATVFALVVLAVLSAATIVASLVVGGTDPLTGLSGQQIAGGRATALVAASWASTAAPMIGFTAFAFLLSVWSRNAAVGIAAPVVVGMVMQLLGALGGLESVRPYLLTTPFEAWHGFLTEPTFLGPLWQGLLTSAIWTAVSLVAAAAILRRRDITGG